MPKITNTGYYPAGTLSIGTDEYTLAIDSAVLTPTTPTTVINDIGGGVQQIAGIPVWALALSIVQDLATASSFSQYLIANAGQIKSATYKPQAGATSKTFTLNLLIIPASIGGAGGSVAKSTVTLPVSGQPTIA
ncbi:hypothetical protein SAMN04487788_1942 [Microbacterium testaceum StLB037]|uniref:Uncharacterized protein n=1 Tax=Microbacterium testaceum (strain StLB037) TaxID=979556 RepID=A0A1H0PR10_MICTS|nr:hypothetical protein [Microbacterium testaceum]SDP07240.1 hypothetical protein SAMN04487788_1942 [Microbacterium testaceum StLB037]